MSEVLEASTCVENDDIKYDSDVEGNAELKSSEESQYGTEGLIHHNKNENDGDSEENSGESNDKIDPAISGAINDESKEGTSVEENGSGGNAVASNSSSGARNRRRNGGRKSGKRKPREETPLSNCIDCQTIDSPFFWLRSDSGERIGPRCDRCHEVKIVLLARRNRKVSRSRVENYLNELLDAHGLPSAQRAEETEDEAWLRVIGENYDEASLCREIIVDIDELDAACQLRHIPDLPDKPYKKRATPLSYDEISLFSYCLKICPMVARLM